MEKDLKDLPADRLMKILREEDPSLVPMTIIPRNEYRSEHDALHVLHTIEKYYEPVIFMKKKTQQTS